MAFQLRKASRIKAKIKIALAGPSGSGKTKSALLMAYGMCGNWEKVALIDSERGSGDIYSNLGPYNVLTLDAPFTPERYIEAIQCCEKEGIEVCIIDSISHEWDGTGGILEIKDGTSGINGFTKWEKVTPRHNAFVNTILSCHMHVICTMRSKQEYVLEENDKGKQVPKKLGLKAVTREGIEYEFTLVFDIDINHHASTSKDRTELFAGKPEFIITPATGERIAEWCNSGEALDIEKLQAEANNCDTMKELLVLLDNYSLFQNDPELQKIMKDRKAAIQESQKQTI